MGGYKLIIGIMAIIFVSLMWIPLNYTIQNITTEMNGLVSDTDAIQRNNMAANGFYFTLLVIVIGVVIYIVKTDKGETEAGEVVYVPAYQ